MIASAPGKLILFGEHSVVYGHAAVAAALSDLRVSVRAEATHDGRLEAELSDFTSVRGGPGRMSVNVDTMRAAINLCDEDVGEWRKPSPPSADTIDRVRTVLLGCGLPPADCEKLLPLLFLCRALLPELLSEAHAKQLAPAKRSRSGEPARPTAPPTGLRISVFSAALPLGAGLGSSAAFSVALAAALLRLRLQVFERGEAAAHLADAAPVRISAAALAAETNAGGDASVVALCPNAASKTLINGWAYAAECILHGTPSGLDNEVASAGEVVKHIRSEGGKRFETVEGMRPMRVLITNTRVARSTRDKVASVAALRTAHPAVTEQIFRSIAQIADSFLATANGGEGVDGEIGSLVRMNHHLLCALGVGSPALDRVVAITNEEVRHCPAQTHTALPSQWPYTYARDPHASPRASCVRVCRRS